MHIEKAFLTENYVFRGPIDKHEWNVAHARNTFNMQCHNSDKAFQRLPVYSNDFNVALLFNAELFGVFCMCNGKVCPGIDKRLSISFTLGTKNSYVDHWADYVRTVLSWRKRNAI